MARQVLVIKVHQGAKVQQKKLKAEFKALGIDAVFITYKPIPLSSQPPATEMFYTEPDKTP